MHVELSGPWHPDVTGEIDRLIRRGFSAAGQNRRDVEVHVKARSARQRVQWFLPCSCRTSGQINRPVAGAVLGHLDRSRVGTLRACRRDRDPDEVVRVPHPARRDWSGRAYSAVPSIANVRRGARYLVVVRGPGDPWNDPYPRMSHYHRAKSAGAIELRSWQDEVLHLAAHEARHVWQFRTDAPRSEVDAECFAQQVLRRPKALRT